MYRCCKVYCRVFPSINQTIRDNFLCTFVISYDIGEGSFRFFQKIVSGCRFTDFIIIQKILGSIRDKFHAFIMNGKFLLGFLCYFIFIFMIKHKIYKNPKIVLVHIQFCFYGSWQYICQISCFSVEWEISNEFFSCFLFGIFYN